MDVERLVKNAEAANAALYQEIDQNACVNQERVLNAFRAQRVAARHFSGTTGYGYDDIGRDTLARIFASLFGTQSALVSPLITGGTHALTIALFGLLKNGDALLSVTGAPYDTLLPVIYGKDNGSLSDYGIRYRQVDLTEGEPDFAAIECALRDPAVKVVFIQRSKGYCWRNAFSVKMIGRICSRVKAIRGDVIIVVDNCYGEFVEQAEPTHAGADIAVGSLIKNIGGGLAPTGGYIAGSEVNIERISSRMTAPGIGSEVGSYAFGYQYFYQGLFLAPHVVAQALKTSCLAGRLFSGLGYETQPKADEIPYDIIRSIRFKRQEELIAFCQSVQYASPVDSFVTPEPWDMPGYEHRVIMAAGTFVGGSSIELSCDSPIKEPYIAYLQGGLTYEHGKIALSECLKRLQE